MELWEKIEQLLKNLWDKLYKFLIGDIMGDEVNPDWFIGDEATKEE